MTSFSRRQSISVKHGFEIGRRPYDQDLKAWEIARNAMKIAADICIYTNDNVIIEKL